VRWQELLRLGIRLSVAGIALVIVMRLPLIVLGNAGTSEEVAHFSAAQRFADAAFVMATALGTALLPGIAFLARSEPARARALLRRVLVGAAALSTVLALAALPLAEFAMRTIFGSDFASGADLLRIILAGLPGYVLLGICWYTIVAFHGETRLLGVGLVGLVIAVAILALAPHNDDGAAWAYVLSLYAMAALSLGALIQQLAAAPLAPQDPAPSFG
jgi:O-antigen/teichoic acid export membrane protein